MLSLIFIFCVYNRFSYGFISSKRWIFMRQSDLSSINTAIKIATGIDYKGIHKNNMGSGGSGASTFIIRDDKSNIEFFVKTSDLSGFNMLHMEYEGIKEIFQTNTIKVPKPICYGTSDYTSFVVFEKLSLGGIGDPKVAAIKLADMHRCVSKNNLYGWDFNNTIGATLQINNWNKNWADFWDKERLGFMIEVKTILTLFVKFYYFNFFYYISCVK